MFWLTLFFGILMGLLSRGLVRWPVQKCFPRILDWHCDVVLIAILLIVSCLSVIDHMKDDVRKRASADEINAIRNKASETTFRRFRDDLRDQAKTNLRSVAKKYPEQSLKIGLSYQSGDLNTELVAFDIVEVVKSAGIQAIVLPNITIISGRLPPLRILLNSHNTNTAQDV